MNTHLKQLWAAMKLPKNFKKSYKFFCLGLDIRVPQVMDTDIRQAGQLSAAGQLLVEGTGCHVQDSVIWAKVIEPGAIGPDFFGQPVRDGNDSVPVLLAVFRGADMILTLFPAVVFVDLELVITAEVSGA